MQMTSRQFNQDTARAKREATKEPVYITARGKPTHVLLTAEDYERLRRPKSLADLFYYPGADEVELPLPERVVEAPRDIDWGDD
jgi:prevent-host-death family protein